MDKNTRPRRGKCLSAPSPTGQLSRLPPAGQYSLVGAVRDVEDSQLPILYAPRGPEIRDKGGLSKGPRRALNMTARSLEVSVANQPAPREPENLRALVSVRLVAPDAKDGRRARPLFLRQTKRRKGDRPLLLLQPPNRNLFGVHPQNLAGISEEILPSLGPFGIDLVLSLPPEDAGSHPLPTTKISIIEALEVDNGPVRDRAPFRCFHPAVGTDGRAADPLPGCSDLIGCLSANHRAPGKGVPKVSGIPCFQDRQRRVVHPPVGRLLQWHWRRHGRVGCCARRKDEEQQASGEKKTALHLALLS